MFVDVGVYGVPRCSCFCYYSHSCSTFNSSNSSRNERFDAEKTTRKVEEFVRSVNGFQMMYADSYMTRLVHNNIC